MKLLTLLLMSLVIAGFSTSSAFAGDCQKVTGGGSKKEAFDGKSLEGLSVEKKSLAALNSKYSELNVTEKVFTGAIQTCSGSSCTDNYVTCQ